jgi:hypothetical protein
VTLAGETPLHARWLADADLRDKVEAAAQRCAEDVWLEGLRIATSEPRRGADGSALAGLDLAASLDLCLADPDLRARLAEAIGTVKAKLPAGMREDPVAFLNFESILADARALTLGRAGAA